MSAHIHRAPRKVPPRKGIQRFFPGQYLELLNATVLRVRVTRDSAPSKDVIHVQYTCCEEPHQTRGSELWRRLRHARHGVLAHPTRCPACARLGDRKRTDEPSLPFAGGPRWAPPKLT